MSKSARYFITFINPIMMFLVCLCLVSFVDAADSQALLDQASSLLTDGQYTQAEQLYQEVSQQNLGTDADLQSRKGLAITYAAQQRHSDVDIVVDRLIRDFPDNKEVTHAVCAIGDQYYTKKDFSRALQLFERVINECPRDEVFKWAQCGIANSSIRLGEDAVADAAISEMVANYSEHEDLAVALYFIADNYREMRKTEKAYDLYQIIAENWPQHERAMWANMHLATRNDDPGNTAAEAAISELIAHYSEHKDIAVTICLIADDYREMRKMEKSTILYQIIAENWPQHERAMWANMHLAMRNIDLGNIELAEAMVDDLLTNYSQHPSLIRAAGYIAGRYYDRQQFDKADQLYQRIAEMHPETIQDMWSQAAGLIATMRLTDTDIPQEAIQTMQADFAAEPNLPQVIIWLGEVYYREGFLLKLRQEKLSDRAKDRFEKALAVWDNNIDESGAAHYVSDAYYGRGLCYWSLGNWFAAADAFGTSIELNPDHRYAGAMHWLISNCYKNLKRNEELDAAEADPVIEWGYQTLFDAYPHSRDVAHAALQLGRINLARGMPVSACVYFNWYLDNAHAKDGQIPEIYNIVQGLEGCGQ